MDIREEINKIHSLRNAGLAFVDYVEALSPGILFKLKGRRWVPSENFVAFTIQHARSQNIAISLRGNPGEFAPFKELKLKKGMGRGSYTECIFDSPIQLPAVALCIQRAFEIYNKGGSRTKKKLKVSEE